MGHGRHYVYFMEYVPNTVRANGQNYPPAACVYVRGLPFFESHGQSKKIKKSRHRTTDIDLIKFTRKLIRFYYVGRNVLRRFRLGTLYSDSRYLPRANDVPREIALYFGIRFVLRFGTPIKSVFLLSK